jgi:hypothetical protein
VLLVMCLVLRGAMGGVGVAGEGGDLSFFTPPRMLLLLPFTASLPPLRCRRRFQVFRKTQSTPKGTAEPSERLRAQGISRSS